jgi:AcrR family transcriptional regulator
LQRLLHRTQPRQGRQTFVTRVIHWPGRTVCNSPALREKNEARTTRPFRADAESLGVPTSTAPELSIWESRIWVQFGPEVDTLPRLLYRSVYKEMLNVATDARTEILNAAIALFARKGYAGTGVQEILDSVELSKPTLYYHFQSKAGLFHAILDHAYDSIYQLMKDAVDRADHLDQKLVAAAEALFNFTRENQDLTRLVFSTMFAPPDEIPPHLLNPAKRRRNQELVGDVFREAQAAGSVARDYSIRDLTYALLGAISHRVRTFLLTGEGELNRHTAQTIVHLFLNGAGAK